MSAMKKTGISVLCGLILLCGIAFAFHFRYDSLKKDYLKRADSVFESNFALLCDNLNQTETEETEEKNLRYTYLCFSMFGLTSYSENRELNGLVHALYDLSEQKVLYERLSNEGKDCLQRLSLNLEDGALAEEVLRDLNLEK